MTACIVNTKDTCNMPVLGSNWELTAPWTAVKVNVTVKFVVGDLNVVYTTPRMKECADVVVFEGAEQKKELWQ